MRALLGLAALTVGLAQVVPVPDRPERAVERTGFGPGLLPYAVYGDPESAALEDVARDPRRFQRRAVRVVGLIEMMSDGEGYALRDKLYQVLLIPVEEMHWDQVRERLGRPTEITGVVRELPEDQGPCFVETDIPQSKCEDPLLPALPDRQYRPSWPKASITYWAVFDATPIEPSTLEDGRQGSALARLAAAPDDFEGQTMTILGQFCGANLYGDLPTSSRRGASDWVLRDGTAAVWIRGKEPKGEGWQLDTHSESESRWWIEATGKVQVEGGIAYLKAKTLTLRRAPRSSDS